MQLLLNNTAGRTYHDWTIAWSRQGNTWAIADRALCILVRTVFVFVIVWFYTYICMLVNLFDLLDFNVAKHFKIMDSGQVSVLYILTKSL